MMELSSSWGSEFYSEYCDDIIQAFARAGSKIEKPGSWAEVSRVTSARTTGNFPLVGEGSTHETLTILHTLRVDGLKPANNGMNTMNQPEMSLAYGLNGNVYRDAVEWTTMLNLGDQWIPSSDI